MRKLKNNPNVILSDSNYPNGRVRNNTGTGNGTPVNEGVYGDIHVNKDKLMDLYGIIPNDLPDNEANGYQIIESLRALAGKNDIIQPLTLASGVLNVPVKFGFMLENEQVICKAGFNLASETQIKGSDNVTLSFTANGSFKTNEYVRLIKNTSSITLVRLADEFSLDSMVGLLNYLKKASQSEEDAGASDLVATTPKVNKSTFTKRVNGADSDTYLATASQNGIYPKEHFTIVDALGAVKNKGWFSGLSVGTSHPTTTYPVSGDIVSAIPFSTGEVGNSGIDVIFANEMPDTNYLVKLYLESEGNGLLDNDCYYPVFKKTNTTSFKIFVARNSIALDQNIKVHIEIEQL